MYTHVQFPSAPNHSRDSNKDRAGHKQREHSADKSVKWLVNVKNNAKNKNMWRKTGRGDETRKGKREVMFN